MLRTYMGWIDDDDISIFVCGFHKLIMMLLLPDAI